MEHDELNEEIEIEYLRKKNGVWGEMKFAQLTTVNYILTSFRMNELEDLKIVKDIPDSGKWKVRELFQREIKYKRVEDEIVPYLKNANELKFFPPLTIAILPTNNLNRIINKIELNNDSDLFEKEYNHPQYKEVYHARILNHYEALKCKKLPNRSYVQWNPNDAALVAIDGQHRLTSLKKLFKDIETTGVENEISEWEIPVTLLFFPDIHLGKSNLSVIECVRQIFIKINSTAQEVSKGRRILLDDLSLVSICIQEFIEYSNDIKSEYLLPMFNWLSIEFSEKANDNLFKSSHLFSIEELENIFKNWLLGYYNDDYSILFEKTFDHFNTEEKEYFNSRKSSGGYIPRVYSNILRDEFQKNVLPGLKILCGNFHYFKEYNDLVRDLLKYCKNNSNPAINSLYDEYYYGESIKNIKDYNQYNDSIKEFMEKYNKIVAYSKSDFDTDDILDYDVGKRALFYSFSTIKTVYDVFKEKTVSLKEYAEWFVDVANKVYKHGWLKKSDKNPGTKEHLRFICMDMNDNIINYKIENIENGLGAYLCYMILKISNIEDSAQSLEISNKIKAYTDDIKESLDITYRKEAIKYQKSLISGDQAKVNQLTNDAIAAQGGNNNAKLIKKEYDSKLKDLASKEANKMLSKFDKDLSKSIEKYFNLVQE